MTWVWFQLPLALLGLLHAAAAYSYFSKAPRAFPWTLTWVVFTVLATVLLPHWPWAVTGTFATAIALWTFWWHSIRASARLDWVVENARQATAQIVDDELIVRDVRNFDWQEHQRCTPRWEDRRYQIGELAAVDLFVCTWGDPRIAHLIVSLVFDDQPPLAFSIETRREVSESWSILAGFMKSYELIVLAADERDVIRVRTNLRAEQVRRYRLKSSPQMRRNLLNQYLAQMNSLARKPRFYNTLFRNCTTEVVRILRASGRRLPLDWRIVVSGAVPDYLYDLGLLEDSRPLSVVTASADIGAAARAADQDPAFWRRIRQVTPPDQVLTLDAQGEPVGSPPTGGGVMV